MSELLDTELFASKLHLEDLENAFDKAFENNNAMEYTPDSRMTKGRDNEDLDTLIHSSSSYKHYVDSKEGKNPVDVSESSVEDRKELHDAAHPNVISVIEKESQKPENYEMDQDELTLESGLSNIPKDSFNIDEHKSSTSDEQNSSNLADVYCDETSFNRENENFYAKQYILLTKEMARDEPQNKISPCIPTSPARTRLLACVTIILACGGVALALMVPGTREGGVAEINSSRGASTSLSSSPTLSFSPSISPRPSKFQTVIPSSQPSKIPIVFPSSTPTTWKPSLSPSVDLTLKPTLQSSIDPTNIPSHDPTLNSTLASTLTYEDVASMIALVSPESTFAYDCDDNECLDYQTVQQRALNYLVNNDTMFQGWMKDEQHNRPLVQRMIQRYIITVIDMSLYREEDSSWLNKETSVCEWEGITCNNVDEMTLVRKIELPSRNIRGSIPIELCKLQNLTVIDLRNNSIDGNIPNCLSQLQQLQKISLEDNKLNGSIPIEIGYLTTLERLDLKNNKLTGNIPPHLTNCTSLSILDLSNNTINGSLPEAIGALSLLKDFRVSSNNLEGNLPSSMSRMKILKILYLDDNHLTGKIDDLIVQGWESLGEFLLL